VLEPDALAVLLKLEDCHERIDSDVEQTLKLGLSKSETAAKILFDLDQVLPDVYFDAFVFCVHAGWWDAHAIAKVVRRVLLPELKSRLDHYGTLFPKSKKKFDGFIPFTETVIAMLSKWDPQHFYDSFR
jgi:hypothetical protein